MHMMEQEKLETVSPRHWIILVLVVGLFSFLGGTRYHGALNAQMAEGETKAVAVRGIGTSAPGDVSDEVDFDQFWDLWNLLKDKFYEQPLSDIDLLYGAMQGMAAATDDPYTVFFEPAVAEEFERSLNGSFEGIGAEIGVKDGQLQIVAPLNGTPASRAGLQPGDAILQIDGTDTVGMSVEEAVYMIRGEGGTTVTLGIGRLRSQTNEAGETVKVPETFDVPIVRETIVVPSVVVEFPEETIAQITISSFNSDTAQEFSKAVEEALEHNATGVILDMRSNPGGYLDRAIAVAGEWVGRDVVVVERRQGEIVDTFHGTGNGRLRDVPTVVLVNGGSASASEIVAGALQDYGIATVIGTQTFGKGSVQDYAELEYGTAVKITVAEWLTPNERSINDVGITPDIIVEFTEQDLHDEHDPQFQKALELLK